MRTAVIGLLALVINVWLGRGLAASPVRLAGQGVRHGPQVLDRSPHQSDQRSGSIKGLSRASPAA